MFLCPKHLTQYYRHGEFLERTIFDSNEYILHDDYAEIVLRNRHCEEVARTQIDLQDIDICKNYKVYLRKTKNVDYAIVSIGNKKIFLHRLIMKYDGNNPIDHVDGNGLNNRRSNLRIVSQSENIFNREKIFRGIKQVQSGKYQVAISKNYQTIYIGTFDTFDEAMEARIKAEEYYYPGIIIGQ